jgi:nucleotide-binding universal stress UspA family protein
MNSGMKLLVAYDGSGYADVALTDLQRAGLPSQAEVIVLSVVERATPLDSLFTLEEEAAGLSKQAAEKLRQAFPTWKVSAESATGSPAWAIVNRADAWAPDLIVVGSRGRSLLERVFFGSVSQQIVSWSKFPVRVGRASRREAAAPPRILLCLDGSSYADAALNALGKRDWPAGTEICLLTAVHSLPEIALSELKVDQARAETFHEKATQALMKTGIHITSTIKEGDPKQVILDQADAWQADCLFLGSRGLNTFHRFWLGSVSTSVVARARCSVEIVH